MNNAPHTASQNTALRRANNESESRFIFKASALVGLNAVDRQRFEALGQGPQRTSSHDRIHRAFEDQAVAHPAAIAVRHEEEALSYAELNRQANHLAHLLIRAGVSPGDRVGLFLRRSTSMVVGIFATLKVGAAYVPQDARIVPTSQLGHVAAVTGMRVILTVSDLHDRMPSSASDPLTIINVDEVLAEADASDADETRNVEYLVPAVHGDPQDACFILFTSGTTGQPNGVEVTHENVCNLILTEPGNLGIKPNDVVSQILNISFDMAAWEIFGALSHGATLNIRGRSIQEAVESANVVIATPSILGSIDASRCQKVHTVAVAGEPCPRPLADTWSNFARFYNSCGPTEVTIVNTMHLYRSSDVHMSIGAPTPNNTVYILGPDLEPCAIGEVGEMWAGGLCVSRGYVNNASLTAERYRPDPFLGGDYRMFRTRDLGRWTEDGSLEHLGRTDDQVKVRGFRVELASVSATLESTPDCLQAVTLKIDARNLAAFVRPAHVNAESARAQVRNALPYYCEPTVIIAMDAFPHTDRGKLDKQKLSALAFAELRRAQPASPTEFESTRSLEKGIER